MNTETVYVITMEVKGRTLYLADEYTGTSWINNIFSSLQFANRDSANKWMDTHCIQESKGARIIQVELIAFIEDENG